MNENQLTVSQLRHANSVLQARLRMIETQFDRHLEVLEQRVRQLEAQQADQEIRLRSATEGVTQFKIISGLASGSSNLMSLIAILKSFLGG